MNLNKVFLIGRLTKDPEIRAMPSGKNVVSFGIATNRIWKDESGNKQETTEFHNIVGFGRLAEICSTYLKKGQLVLVEGRVQTRSWQGQDNAKKYRTEIIMENMQMGPRAAGKVAPPAEPKKETPAQEEIPVIEEEGEIEVKNIPF